MCDRSCFIGMLMLPNGAADKPREAVKSQAFPPEVGLIRVVVRRFAPRKQRIAIRRPVVAGATEGLDDAFSGCAMQLGLPLLAPCVRCPSAWAAS